MPRWRVGDLKSSNRRRLGVIGVARVAETFLPQGGDGRSIDLTRVKPREPVRRRNTRVAPRTFS